MNELLDVSSSFCAEIDTMKRNVKRKINEKRKFESEDNTKWANYIKLKTIVCCRKEWKTIQAHSGRLNNQLYNIWRFCF